MVVINCASKEIRKYGYNTLKEWLDSSPDNIYIGRGERIEGASKSKWFNPFPLSKYSRDESLDLYRTRILTTPDLYNSIDELKNKNMACWCSPDDCHGNVLEKLVSMTKQDRLKERRKLTPTTLSPKEHKQTKEPKEPKEPKQVKEKGDMWDKKLQALEKEKIKQEARLKKLEEETIKKEKEKEEYLEKKEEEKNKKKEIATEEKELIKQFSSSSNADYNQHILAQIQPNPLPTTKRVDNISEKLYQEIITALPDTEFDGKARKYSYIITKIALYGVTYPTPIMNEINGIMRVLAN